ncbi:EAL domain-containing protein [Kluyvera intermedia]|uniref:EAL domain-containing protein n=1 Tax=Kluyvera intermedia TaxID=61648 RepID=UPI0013E0333C|nr:EAL domain-containing protein [Kluyvera intermedia]WQD29274.1 EAL domain-containing protein [Kluyvera intermedia]
MLTAVKGMRLQPLVDLQASQCLGYEVLAKLSTGEGHDDFFQALSAEAHLLLFLRQMEALHRLKGEEKGLFFLNLPVRVLNDAACFRRLKQIRLCYRRNMVIEVQDPATLLTLDPAQREMLRTQIRRLRMSGWRVWLDDLTPAVQAGLAAETWWFDGVKTDRDELQRQTLPALVKQARHLGRQVLVEGIETEAVLLRARASGAEWGQGYLWPEREVAFCL